MGCAATSRIAFAQPQYARPIPGEGVGFVAAVRQAAVGTGEAAHGRIDEMFALLDQLAAPVPTLDSCAPAQAAPLR